MILMATLNPHGRRFVRCLDCGVATLVEVWALLFGCCAVDVDVADVVVVIVVHVCWWWSCCVVALSGLWCGGLGVLGLRFGWFG